MSKEAVAAGVKYLLYSVVRARSLGAAGHSSLRANALDHGLFIRRRRADSPNRWPWPRRVCMLLWALFAMIDGLRRKGRYVPHARLAAHGAPGRPGSRPAPCSVGRDHQGGRAGHHPRGVLSWRAPISCRGTWVQAAWMTLALDHRVHGLDAGYRGARLLKKRLAYSSGDVRSVYVLTGLSTLSRHRPLWGALMHIVFHSRRSRTACSCLRRRRSSTRPARRDVRGAARHWPAACPP